MNGLSVGDGFKFGCGFMLAGLVAWLVMAIIGGIITLIFGGALGAIFGNLDLLSQVPQLLGIL
jgi:hypothetical protein